VSSLCAYQAALQVLQPSPFPTFWYSQDARPYALFIFSTALVLWLYLRDVRQNKFSLAYCIALLVLAISHYFAVVPGMFLLTIDVGKQIFAKKKRKLTFLLWEYIPYIIVFGMLLYFRLANFNLTPDVISGPAPVFYLPNWEMIYANLAFGYRRLHLLAWLLVLVGMAVVWFKRREVTIHFLLGGSLGVAALMLLCIYIFRFRYFYYLMPEMVLFMAVALVWSLEKLLALIKLNSMVWTIIGLGVISTCLVCWCYEPLVTRMHGEKMDYRALAVLYNNEADQGGTILVPIGDYGLTLYPPYNRGAINNSLVATKPEAIYGKRIVRWMLTEPRGLAVFPTAEQLHSAITFAGAQGYHSFARLYIFGFHVLVWDRQLNTTEALFKGIDKYCEGLPILNRIMSRVFYYEDLDNYPAALMLSYKALEINQDSSDILATRARILRAMGQDKKAALTERRAWMIYVLMKNSTYVD
jgi:hypothetical protein